MYKKLCDYYVFGEFQPTKLLIYYLILKFYFPFPTTQCYINIEGVILNRNINLRGKLIMCFFLHLCLLKKKL